MRAQDLDSLLDCAVAVSGAGSDSDQMQLGPFSDGRIGFAQLLPSVHGVCSWLCSVTLLGDAQGSNSYVAPRFQPGLWPEPYAY